VLFLARIEGTFGLFATYIALGCPVLCLCAMLIFIVDCDGGRDTMFFGGRFFPVVLDSVCFVVDPFGLGRDLRRNRFDALPAWIVELSL